MDGYGMRYNHYSELPIGAFEPICGRMKLFGGGGNPIQAISDAVSNVGESISNVVSDNYKIPDMGGLLDGPLAWVDQQVVQPISNEVSNAAQTVGDVGNQIDQSVNDTIPGGWATVGAAALAAATYGGSLAAEGAGEGLAAAPELDATGSMASQAAASQAASAGAGAGLTDTGLSMIPPETPIPDYTPTYDYSPTTAVTNASPELDATSSLSQQALQAPVIDMSPTTPVANVSPELDPTGSLATPTYDFSPNTPVQNVSPELDPTGSMATGTSASDIANALRAANSANNLIKSLTSSQQQLATNQQNLQQSQALGNLLKANQFTPIATPEVYKAQNPFTFGQQEPIQGNPLASLLRNNYGNS